jgi:tetratricopeptide (TPR) repeat protein
MSDEKNIRRVLEEWAELRERGDDTATDEILRAHPELADELREHFDALEALDGAHATNELPEDAPREIGDYRIVREIGRGGMGVVYEAVQTSLDRRVALKVLSLSITNTANAVRRFQREARAAASIHHTNIVPIYGMGSYAGQWYYAMELVQGRALDEVVKDLAKHKSPPTERRLARRARNARDTPATSWTGAETGQRAYYARVAEIFAGVAEALHAAHAEGILHRDIKPSNLLLDADGVLKIADFGLARVDGADVSMTATGDLLGTPAYMSPEQAMAKRITLDHRTDIYSLGATLYETLTLKPPFSAKDLPGLCTQILSKDPPSLRKRDGRIPRDLETIVLKSMEKDRDRRYASAADMARDLRRFADGLAVQARRAGPIERAWRRIKRHKVRSSLAAAALLMAAVGAFFARRAWEEARVRRGEEYERLLLMADASGSGSFHFGNRVQAYVDQAVALDPDRPEAYWFGLLADGVDLAFYDEAHHHGIPNRTRRLARAGHLALGGEWEQAEAEFAAAGDRIDAESALDRYFRARFLDERGDRAAALALLDEVIRDSTPRGLLHTVALRRRARLRTRREDHAGALADWQRLRDTPDPAGETRFRIALAWRKTGNDEKAEQSFEDAMAWLRERDDPIVWASASHICTEWPPWLDRLTQQALARFPDDGAVLRCRGVAAARAGRTDESITLYRRSMERIEPDDPDRGLTALNLAIQLAHADRLDEAREALEAADRVFEPQDPTWARVQYTRALILERSGRPAEALEACRRGIARRPTHAPFHYLAGHYHHRAGRQDAARQSLGRCLELDPSHVSARATLAQVHLADGRVDEAERECERAIEEDESGRNTLPHFVLASVHRARGNYEEAIAAIDRGLAIEPDDSGGLNNKGVLLGELNRPEEALACYERALRLREDAAAHYGVGLSHWRLGDFDKARESFRAAIALDDARFEAHLNLGCILHDHDRDYAAAEKAFRRAVELEPDNATARTNLGNALASLNRADEAIREYDQAIRVSPDFLNAHYGRARMYFARRRWRDLLDATKYLEGRWPQKASVHYFRAMALGNLGRVEDALPDFRALVELQPTNPIARMNLGTTYRRLGRYDEACDEFVRGIELGAGPKPGQLWFVAFQLSVREDASKRQPERAVEYAQRAREAQPDDPRTWLASGAALYRAGKFDPAAEALAKARDLGLDAPELHLLLAMTESRRGNEEEAKAHLDAARASLDGDSPSSKTVDALRREAESLLGK